MVAERHRFNEDKDFRERFDLNQDRRDKRKQTELRQALSKINRQFRHWDELLNDIRNKLAFGVIEAAFQRLGEDEPWD